MPYLSRSGSIYEVDARAALWALGVILYELLSGESPFNAVARGTEHRPRRLSRRRFRHMHYRDQGDRSRLLAPQPDDRYGSAGAVLSDLGLFEAGHPPEALTQGFPERLDEAPTRRTRQPADTESEATRRTERSVLALGRGESGLPPASAPNPGRPAAATGSHGDAR